MLESKKICTRSFSLNVIQRFLSCLNLSYQFRNSSFCSFCYTMMLIPVGIKVDEKSIEVLTESVIQSNVPQEPQKDVY